ncbi:uncharacterized protein LOC143781341 [Ranitomeya variabilis]|uniref:uncharacterized protein LOC143781341 n=1 Tax=Ranitomeya variabilis TaxID=490064 RepID=UPI0040571D72
MATRVLKVSGLPRHQDHDLIRDKLLIHFLQEKHGGDGEVTTHYPTEEDGVALLEFKDEKVANRVLSRNHHLIIHDCSHPLEVRRPQSHDSQFSLPITTYLDLSHFRNVSEVKRLLEQHRLCIYQEKGLVLAIKGDFSDLGRCRVDLYGILSREEPIEKPFSPLEPTARKHLSEEMGRRAPQNVPLTPERRSSSSSRLKSEDRGHLAQDSVTRESPTKHSSTPTSSRETPTRTAMTPTRVRKVSEPVSFLADGAVCRYVGRFQREVIDTILRQDDIDINEEHCEGFTSITLTSRAPEKQERFKSACDQIKTIFDYYQNRLRAENIELSTDSQEEIIKMQDCLHKRNICLFHTAPRTLTIIGLSDEILNFMQEWKGAGGKMVQNNSARSGSPRSSEIGMDSKNLATNEEMSTHPGTSGERSRRRETGHDTRVSGRLQDAAGSGAPAPTHVQKLSEPVTFHADDTVFRYVEIFEQKMIDAILKQYSVDIKTENYEGFTSITLTPRPPEKPEHFKMACGQIKTIFDNYQNLLRAENIELVTGSKDEINKIGDYLLKRHICSFKTAPRSLKIIGPSEEILYFLQEWKRTGGKMIQTNSERSGSPRSFTMGADNKNLATNSRTSTHHGASGGRSGDGQIGHDTNVTGRGRQPDSAGSARPNLSSSQRR